MDGIIVHQIIRKIRVRTVYGLTDEKIVVVEGKKMSESLIKQIALISRIMENEVGKRNL